ncbi:MAG: flagellar export protein FliJ [Spirochaetia bacterium]|nr:flagellar export protein FliJ [Spirochaetia bacterium]
MKKFRFKLETVLNVKEQKEELLKTELLKLQAQKIEQEQMLKEIKEKRAYFSRQKSDESKGITDIQSLIYFEQYISSLLIKIDNTKNKIKELEKQADIKRVEVVEASREKKVFEKLKKKEFEEFEKAILYNEQKVLDEIAVNKFNRKEQHSY